MPLTPEQHRSINEDLLSQINVDNVLKVAVVFQQHADEIEEILLRTRMDLVVGLCGDDPISAEARASFQAKVDHIRAVHEAHAEELRAAVAALRRSASTYGYTEREIVASLGPLDEPVQ